MKFAVIFCFLSAFTGVISGDSCGDEELGTSCPDDFSVFETILLFPFSVLAPPQSSPPEPVGYVDAALTTMTNGLIYVYEWFHDFFSMYENTDWRVADTCEWLRNTVTVVDPEKLLLCLDTIQELGSNAYKLLIAFVTPAFDQLAAVTNAVWTKLADLGETPVVALMQDAMSVLEAAVWVVVDETADLWDQAAGVWRQTEDEVGVPVLYSLLTVTFITIAAISYWRYRMAKLNRKLEVMSQAKADAVKRHKIYSENKTKKTFAHQNHDLLFEAMTERPDCRANAVDTCSLWLAHGDDLENDTTPILTRRLSPIIETKERYSDPKMGRGSKLSQPAHIASPRTYSDRPASPTYYNDFKPQQPWQQRRAHSARMFANEQVDLMNLTAESDIGEPCCNSSFIEDMEKRYQQAPICYDNGRGDGTKPTKHQPKGILTKRWPKEELGLSFTPDTSLAMDDTDHTADTTSDVEDNDNSTIDMSALSKSLSLYGGDTMPLQEMAVVYAVQSVWKWAKKYIRKRSHSASRPSSRDCSRLSTSFQKEHKHSKQCWKTHSLNNSKNQNKSQNCMDEMDSEVICNRQTYSSSYCSPPDDQEVKLMSQSGSMGYEDSRSAQNGETHVQNAEDNDCNDRLETKSADNEDGSGDLLLSFSESNDLDEEIITGDSSLYGEYCCPNIQNARIVHVPLIETTSEPDHQIADAEEENEDKYEQDDDSFLTDYDTDKKKMTQLLTDLNLLEELTGRDKGCFDETEDIFEYQNPSTDTMV